jgi:hypothetical protein
MGRAQVEGAFSEAAISKAHLFWLDVLVRLAREKRLRMTDLGWHGQHSRANLCGYGTPSCFIAGAFPGYFYSASTLGNTFPDLLNPGPRLAGTISVRGGTDYECVKHGWSEVKVI